MSASAPGTAGIAQVEPLAVQIEPPAVLNEPSAMRLQPPAEHLELPPSGLAAAQLCATAARPRSDPAQLRAVAARASAFADELTRCAQSMTENGSRTDWTGIAADDFRARLRSSAPNLGATAHRYQAYAAAVGSYATALDGLAWPLEVQARQLAQDVDVERSLRATSLSATSLSTAGQQSAALSPAATGLSAAATANLAQSQLEVVRRNARDADLLAAARRFAVLHEQWLAAMQACVQLVRHADAADPGRDLRGWAAFRHDAVSITKDVVPFVEVAAHASWANASNALSLLGSDLTIVGVGLLLVCPPAAGVVLAVAAAVAVLQTGVDLYRQQVRHEDVSMADLGWDASGALPWGHLAAESRAVTRAGRSGWELGDGAGRVKEMTAAAAARARTAVGQAKADLPSVWGIGATGVPRDLFRSRAHGGVGALAKRWGAPVLWDLTNAATGLPAAGATSVPQLAWRYRPGATHDRPGAERRSDPVLNASSP